MLQKIVTAFVLVLSLSFPSAWARSASIPLLTAKSAVVVDATSGGILYSKNPHWRLPPASTVKLMTVLVALEKLPLDKQVPVSVYAVSVSPSKAGLTAGVTYSVKDLVTATLVSSSNDAAIALAEAAGGSEINFVVFMNEKARAFGMNDTKFVNSTGLTNKRRKQYSTAYDLTLLMREAVKNPAVDEIMGLTSALICGSDGKQILLRTHNKMLWKMPKLVKGKTGWTAASKHTFVGTDYSPNKIFTFAMLCSKKPWTDIERLASIGLEFRRKN